MKRGAAALELIVGNDADGRLGEGSAGRGGGGARTSAAEGGAPWGAASADHVADINARTLPEPGVGALDLCTAEEGGGSSFYIREEAELLLDLLVAGGMWTIKSKKPEVPQGVARV